MTIETRQRLQMLGRILHRLNEAVNDTGNWAEYEAYWLVFNVREAIIRGRI